MLFFGRGGGRGFVRISDGIAARLLSAWELGLSGQDENIFFWGGGFIGKRDQKK